MAAGVVGVVGVVVGVVGEEEGGGEAEGHCCGRERGRGMEVR